VAIERARGQAAPFTFALPDEGGLKITGAAARLDTHTILDDGTGPQAGPVPSVSEIDGHPGDYCVTFTIPADAVVGSLFTSIAVDPITLHEAEETFVATAASAIQGVGF